MKGVTFGEWPDGECECENILGYRTRNSFCVYDG